MRLYAIQLHDQGDGHGVDWAKVAETCCKVAFRCLRELPPDDRDLHSVARRAHDAAYSLMTATSDSGAPYTIIRSSQADAHGRPVLPLPGQAPKS
ncbi:hypothetical protein P7D22_11480 [Lichenihabitans sp. Uapishka_5]|uniref:hypothetical protein n=1 Tax=Lichenihabitans sp. Uapishka_5 TaxID=3037302 RepID=UPI0029E8179C|nr:hypothetical protein [Lichenihabitans sp. Uapishka_5]MDX7951790.1 hypothetical protein [Lichenihabitans sp. Uapishka_5]